MFYEERNNHKRLFETSFLGCGFELNKYQSFFIQRVLEYGKMKDWNLIKDLYGMEAIKEASLNARSLDAVTLSFVSTLFNINKTEFRCFKHRQLFQNLWNS
ncbi:MAG: hypothetical protein PHC28_01515 [Flavobacterium sp.]|uniref:DUF6922 domain-containing protein n=1 Tax=Flavobacterium sp. TaxID=239 RepID=UPI00261A9FB4|nr:hypothetical protein [Flavobacterium sp.]MDD5149145.1 hypothetical protein [Flavobacterium sp.]